MKKILVFILFFFLAAIVVAQDFDSLRDDMVNSQIVKRGVTNKRVLDVMRTVPRHRFVPNSLAHAAYFDRPLPIGHNQTISQPYIVALMTELLELKGNEKVLEIGTGSGYQAAILSLLCKEVYTIELLEPLAHSASMILKQLGYKNIEVKHGDGYLGWEEHAPFDAIIVTASPKEIPPKLIEQLKEGGRMVLPVGTNRQELKLVIKDNEGIKVEKIISVRFVPMVRDALD